jgi:hypothetical protein
MDCLWVIEQRLYGESYPLCGEADCISRSKRVVRDRIKELRKQKFTLDGKRIKYHIVKWVRATDPFTN